MAYAAGMNVITTTAARANLYRLIDVVNEESTPVTISGQRHNAVLVGEDDWRAIQETLYLSNIPGFVESVKEARREGGTSEALDW
ncbi:prevent-host-death family protein [Actinotignum schaalii FB123-CNA-2]|uniref:Antitoxin n=2 Tax=Actinotignum schaalii TaxID=59505 RepID=S2WL29_9ACTO|nr:prevent-host-death family protein [Actinotignum schaalii FB123-CNA-2]